MDILEFGNVIVSEIRDVLGADIEVELKDIDKNNGVKYHAVIIRKKEDTVAPTIYIDNWFEEFKNGRVLMSIVKEIIDIYKEHTPAGNVDMDFFGDFSKVNDKLFFKLVNYDKNESFLEEVPYRQFEDLALVPLCRVVNEYLGSGVIVIKNEHLRAWEISSEELWENVMENAAHVTPYTVESILECLGGEFGGDIPDDPECNMYVISNKEKTYGASAFLYPGVLKHVSKKLNDNLIIIPSSIHEVIVIPGSSDIVDNQRLISMVKEVNSTVVSNEEILSDNIYYYDSIHDTISLIS